jgi:hypothetical protein
VTTRRRIGVALGTLVICGVLLGLWLVYRPSPPVPQEATPPPAAPLLRDAHARVVLLHGGTLGATISCDGRRRRATGFWAGEPATACDALAATRGALLDGPGCKRTDPNRTVLHATGRFGTRRFDHRAQFDGCPDPEGWLAVNVLARPVRAPEQRLTGR